MSRVGLLPTLQPTYSLALDDSFYVVNTDVLTDDPSGSSFRMEARWLPWTDGNQTVITGGGTLHLPGGDIYLPAVAEGESLVDTNSAQTLSSKELITPKIVNFSNAQHNHSNAAGGGIIDHGALDGRDDDDHTQYYNQARGDARYSQLGHTHPGDPSPAWLDPDSFIDTDWSKAGGQYLNLQYRKVGDIVYWEGAVTCITGDPDKIILNAIPSAYQPVERMLFPVSIYRLNQIEYGSGTMYMDWNGYAIVYPHGFVLEAFDKVSFSGIHYSTTAIV